MEKENQGWVQVQRGKECQGTCQRKKKKETGAAQDKEMEKGKTAMGCRTEMKDDKKEGERTGQKRREKKKRER